MNSYVKVEWRLRLRSLNEKLAMWQKQAEQAVREWSHMTELGLQQVYQKLIFNMVAEAEDSGVRRAKFREVIIERPVLSYSNGVMPDRELTRNLEVEMSHSVKLLEKLEDEVTKRRLLEDEVHNLKHELNDIKNISLPNSPVASPRTYRSTHYQISPRSREMIRGGSFRSNVSSSFDQSVTARDRSVVSEGNMALVRLSPRRQVHLSLSPDVRESMFDHKPTTIAKDFKSLFDNEWTKVYADMRRDYSEQYVVDLLLSWLKDCYLTCIAITEDQRENIKEDALKCFIRYFNASKALSLPNACTSSIKEFQCKIALEAVPFIKKVCVRRLLSGEENAELPLKYIKRCAELCWLMCVQNPPMILYMDVVHGELINRKLFTSLVPRGEIVEYLVWPAVFRFSGGHMLQRGVVKTVS